MGNKMGTKVLRFGQRVLYGPPEVYLTEDELWERRAREATLIPILAHKVRTFEPDDEVPGQGWRTMNILSAGLGFDVQIINQLYSLFCIADVDQSGMIDVYEFLLFFQLENSPFNLRMFAVFDMDASGEIDFLEFACAIWNLCTWPAEELPKLMFCVYDRDNSGELDLQECEDLVMDVYAQRKVKTGAAILIDSLRGIAKPGLYREEIIVSERDFVAWAGTHEECYFPLKCQRIMLRNKVLGEEYWDHIGARSRERTMRHLQGIIRQTLGPPGAEEAVRMSLEKAADFRARELQRKQQKKMWEEEEEEAADLDGETRVRRQREAEEEEMLQERLKAVSYLRVARNKRYKEWYKTLAKIEGRSDPLSMLLQFSNRDLARTLRGEFNEAWARATADLQRRTYDREGRLRRLVGNQKAKEDLYFVRKNPLALGEEEMRDSRVRYSTTDEKLTWAEQRHEAHKRRKRELRHAGGNAHLAHGVVSSQGLLASKERLKNQRRLFGDLGSDAESDAESDESEPEKPDEVAEEKGGGGIVDYDTDDEDAERERRTEELHQRRRADLIRQGYANAPASSRRVAKPGQYVLQNLKRADPAWRAKMQRRAQRLQQGLDPASGTKPFRPPRGRRLNARVFAL